MDECLDVSGSEEEDLDWRAGGDGEKVCEGAEIERRGN